MLQSICIMGGERKKSALSAACSSLHFPLCCLLPSPPTPLSTASLPAQPLSGSLTVAWTTSTGQIRGGDKEGRREARPSVARSAALGGCGPWRAGAEADGEALPNTGIGRYAELVMAHLVEEINDSDYFSDGVPKEMMRVDDVLVRIANISLIEEKMAATGPGKITNIFPNYLLYEFQGLSGGRIWKAEHDLLLLRGILKHGYARWQYISDDRENGLFEAARRELHLPSVNEIIGAQLNEANGNLEGAQEGQANTTSMSHYKEIQRKIVEFLRKRYHLMERALNMEYAVIKKKIPVPDDITEQGVPAGHAPFIPDISELLRELPNLEPISTNELVSEGTAGQLQVPHLYNKMCGVLEESGAYALSSFFGDKSASSSLANSLRQFETVCENVVEALRPHQNGTGSAIKEELVDAATKAAAAAAPQQDSGHDAPHGQSSTAKADMEIDG
ncbi:Putative homeodomain-like transcription factor superfamily protein [Zea mays]|uniref:Putative homeodomain-like transcription factor superfamily protein n=1 Tax=Zea mays TaxID=4577 RepID=A0A1D6NTS2_MAIZE|nr:Putative homeodomain-like transcription factor superfamily protein [Zea mays]